MLDMIEKTVFEVTGKKGLTAQTDFVKDLALNSFDIMNIISAFEDKFDIVIPVRDVWQMRKVEDVMVYFEKKGIS